MNGLLVVVAHSGNKRQLQRALDSMGVTYKSVSSADDVDKALNNEEVRSPVLVDADGLGRDVGAVLEVIRTHGVGAAVLTRYPKAFSPAKVPTALRVVQKPPSLADFRAIVTELTEGHDGGHTTVG